MVHFQSTVCYISRSHIFNKTLTHISLQLTLRMSVDLVPRPSAQCWLPLSYTHTHIQRKGYFMKGKMKSPWINQSVECGLSPLIHFVWTQSWFRLHCLFTAGPNCVGGSGRRILMEINIIKIKCFICVTYMLE